MLAYSIRNTNSL